MLGQHRSTQRKVPHGRADEESLTADIVALASQYGRYGYRRIAAMLRDAGWAVNVKRVERIWRREGLKVPQKQPKKGRLWLNDGSCIRLRPERPNHVWSYDFVESRTHDGRKFRMLNVIDEFTRECLSIRIDRKLNSTAVIDVLTDLFILRGVPGHVRSDNVLCSERLADLGVRSCSRWSIPARHQSAAGRALGQRAVSPITNTEYAHGGSHRPQDEILSQPSGRPEHYLRVTNRNHPGFGLQTSVFLDHIVYDYRARRDRIICEHNHIV